MKYDSSHWQWNKIKSMKHYKNAVNAISNHCLPFDFSRSTEYPMKIPALVCSSETFSPLAAQKKKRKAFICVFFYRVSGKFILKNSAISGKISSGKFSICFYAFGIFIVVVGESRLNGFFMTVSLWRGENLMYLRNKIGKSFPQSNALQQRNW